MSSHSLAGAVRSGAGSAPRARKAGKGVHRSQITGLVFATPAIVLVAVFVIYPIVGTVALSLTDWDGFSPTRTFVGLQNFADILADGTFQASVVRNLIYIGGFFVSVVLGFAIAVLLWVRPRGWVVFRTVFLIPEMLGPAIVGLVWLRLWQPANGGLAALGDALHIPVLASSPLASPGGAIWVLALTQVWASTGFFVVVALGGLQSLDPSLLDAAAVDGAGRWQRLRYVVIPSMRPFLALMTMLATIAGLKAFDLVWVMTQGGPGNATQLLGTYAYTKAFSQSDFGHASAIACVMVLIALAFTLLTGRRNVRDS